MESDLKGTFQKMVEARLENDLERLVAAYYQTQLSFKSELEEFRFKAQRDENFLIPPSHPITQPRKSKLERKVETQFQTATASIERLLYTLTENRETFNIFSTKFLDQYLDECVKDGNADPKLDAFFELLVHRLLVDITNEVQDWRVVEVQKNLIQHQVEQADNFESLFDNKVL